MIQKKPWGSLRSFRNYYVKSIQIRSFLSLYGRFLHWTFLMHNNCWKKISTYLRLMFPFFTPSGFLIFSGSIKREILAWNRLVFYITVMRGIRIRNGTINIHFYVFFQSWFLSSVQPAVVAVRDIKTISHVEVVIRDFGQWIRSSICSVPLTGWCAC